MEIIHGSQTKQFECHKQTGISPLIAGRRAILLDESLHDAVLRAADTDSSCSDASSNAKNRRHSESACLIRDSSFISAGKRRCGVLLPFSLSVLLLFITALILMLFIFAVINVKQTNLTTICDDEMNGESSPTHTNKIDNQGSDNDLDVITERILASFDGERIKSNIRWLAKRTHIAGTRENNILMKEISEEYTRLGFDVRMFNYTVLLNYPDFHRPNTLEILDDSLDEWQFVSIGMGKTVGPAEARAEQEDIRARHWWSAYSANGSVTGRLVYANYGLKEDYEQLAQISLSVRDKIVLLRHGASTRSEKVREAELQGCAGVLLFSDPLHYTTTANSTFPSDIYLPPFDAQRGSILLTQGDPQSPLFPSLPYVSRSETERTARAKGVLPKIPVLPISNGDALRIMSKLNGEALPTTEWRGGLQTNYRVTGDAVFRLTVRSHFTHRAISNVIATLKGQEFPDQMILVGGHVDAWNNGAIDPITGSATQLEMARVASQVFGGENGRLKRSLVFCHFDAEEFGLIGSTEWLEQMNQVLQSRAVAYLNVDHIAGNVTLDVKGVPLLYRIVSDSAKKVPHPNIAERNAGRMTLYDSWRYYRGKGYMTNDLHMPDVGLPVGGSDYHRFVAYSGIPSLDLKMESSPGASYPLYHTMYETPWLVDNLQHPSPSAFVAIGQLWLEIAHRLANEIILPLNAVDFAKTIVVFIQRVDFHFAHLNITKLIPNYDKKMEFLQDSAKRFKQAADQLQAQIESIYSSPHSSTSLINRINSRLLLLERCFLDPHAFPSPLYRHLLYSPSRYPSQVNVLSLLQDPARDYRLSRNVTHLGEISMAFTRLQYAIENASELLKID
ncbi:hypothetical protein WR25_01668 [Diploscapter pachys]|uniref:Peptidase M28 domain-containing protein n=1 Tax=Diploscapter pachys TaxID=2018661 RepID=A0A2A2JS28_9BILA|nr:hypothetical protein WR25_01668 [Diploscapter pachys]